MSAGLYHQAADLLDTREKPAGVFPLRLDAGRARIILAHRRWAGYATDAEHCTDCNAWHLWECGREVLDAAYTWRRARPDRQGGQCTVDGRR